MSFPYDHVAYEQLNSKQQGKFNFAKASGVLADYGFTTFRLTDDWNGADFLALRVSGETLTDRWTILPLAGSEVTLTRITRTIERTGPLC